MGPLLSQGPVLTSQNTQLGRRHLYFDASRSESPPGSEPEALLCSSALGALMRIMTGIKHVGDVAATALLHWR